MASWSIVLLDVKLKRQQLFDTFHVLSWNVYDSSNTFVYEFECDSGDRLTTKLYNNRIDCIFFYLSYSYLV